MRYSCFKPETGLYDYFEDGRTLPLNADLPVPSLGADSGKAGLASIHAARTMPSGTKKTGSGWHARGQVVKCPGQGVAGLGALRGLGALDTSSLVKGAVVVGALGFGLWFLFSITGGAGKPGPIDEGAWKRWSAAERARGRYPTRREFRQLQGG